MTLLSSSAAGSPKTTDRSAFFPRRVRSSRRPRPLPISETARAAAGELQGRPRASPARSRVTELATRPGRTTRIGADVILARSASRNDRRRSVCGGDAAPVRRVRGSLRPPGGSELSRAGAAAESENRSEVRARRVARFGATSRRFAARRRLWRWTVPRSHFAPPKAPARLTGTDISSRILETAAATIARERGVAELVRANLEGLPFADETFDLVICVQVIEHLVDPQLGIQELARVLRPGGVLVLTTDNKGNRVSRILNAPRSGAVAVSRQRGRRQKVRFPHISFTAADIRWRVANAGLRVEHDETFQFHIDDLAVAPVKRALNALDRALPPHYVGDIIAVVARRPNAA